MIKILSGYELRHLLDKDARKYLRYLNASSFHGETHITIWDNNLLIGEAELKQSPYDKDEWWFMHVNVRKGYERQGIAKTIIIESIRFLEENKVKKLSISSFSEEGKKRLEKAMRMMKSEIDIHFMSDGPRRVLEDFDPEGFQIQEGYSVEKFWIKDDGSIIYVEPNQTHAEALHPEGRFTTGLFDKAIESGWVRAYFEHNGSIMNYNYDEKKITRNSLRAMKKLAREYKAQAYNIENFGDFHQTGKVINEAIEGLKTYYTITDSYHGQLDGYVQAHIGDMPVGYMNFTIYDGITRIKMIEVAESYRRKGVATALYRELEKNTDGEIEWGYTTEDGAEFKKSLKADVF